MWTDQAVRRWGWVAEQVGHRVGALGLMAVCAGVGLMVAGKRPFAGVLAGGFAAAVVGAVASVFARRWGARGVWGLVAFNVVVAGVAAVGMVASRLGWWHVVGVMAGVMK